MHSVIGNLAIHTIHGKLVINSPDLDIDRPVVNVTLVSRRALGHSPPVRGWLAVAQAVPALGQRGQSHPRAGAHPGDPVEQGPAGSQVGAHDAGVEVDRRPQGRPREIRLSAVGQVTQDDLGDAGEQDACSTMSDGAALFR